MQPSPLEQQQLDVAVAPSFWHHVRFEFVRRHATQLGAHTVFDIGAGSGLLGDHVRGTTLAYRFTESSPLLRAALIERFGADALVGDAETIDAGSLVTLLDVVEHVEDDLGLLTDLARRMTPGAGLVITAPAMQWLFSSWDRDLGHQRRYSRRSVSDLVRSAGFDVDAASYLFPELVPIAALRRFRSSDGTTAEFPDLPRWIDRIGRGISSATTRVRRVCPVGTSVVVTATRRGGSQ